MPSEEALHEGTWLQWPHDYTYSFGASDFEPTWVEITEALVTSENVHIIAYNEEEKNHIEYILGVSGVSMENVDIFIIPNDDFWVRDNGPIFVYNQENQLHITDWGFNGWGGDTPHELCDEVPNLLAPQINLPLLDLNTMVLEGGAIEVDGAGSMMATRSSITGSDRNPNLTESEIENYMTTYLGLTNFIWLDGIFGGWEDITDQHIDGFAKFHETNTIITMNEVDLDYWYVSADDIYTLYNATQANGEVYNYVYLPLTDNNVVTTWGQNLGYKGSYVNYYIANTLVLVPNYNDPQDNVANAIIQELYPEKEVVGIDSRNILANGGMVHCITQQQPQTLNPIGLNEIESLKKGKLLRVIDLFGRDILNQKENTLYLYIYENGVVEVNIREI
tara:strand:- start:1692 stop:2864 length:1173 start_codon:yes stop_codon:yes gene_type:complete